MMEARFLSLLLLLFSAMTSAASAQRIPSSYERFTSDASTLPSEATYDYIIVGGGTAGCPLAATLSAGGHSVLLLERGGPPHEFPTTHTFHGFMETLNEADDRNNTDSPAQRFDSEEGVQNVRGRILGRSSAISAGSYTRAHPQFFNESGAHWDMDMVEKAYLWVEQTVAFMPKLGRWQTAVRDGLIEAHVGPDNGYTVEHVEGTKIGATIFDSNGTRHSAAELLRFANTAFLCVATRATVSRILFNSDGHKKHPKAIGVVYSDRHGKNHTAMTKRPGGEVIVSAGAIGSPQLLLLSGIGGRSYLSSLGIPVVADHPEVGLHMSDNPRNGISIYPYDDIEEDALIQVVGIINNTSIEASTKVVGRTQISNRPYVFITASIFEQVSGPVSEGSLSLADLNVRVNPKVGFNYFSSQVDLDRCVSGLRKIADVLETKSMAGLSYRPRVLGRKGGHGGRGGGGFVFGSWPLLPPDLRNDKAMEQYCKDTVTTIWNYHGGCLVGKVVDADYRVTGVDGLRVIDGSTLTVTPGSNPQATLMMMGRYMGMKIIKERKKHGRHFEKTIKNSLMEHGERGEL